jgi:lysophospholipase L1-like esterase
MRPLSRVLSLSACLAFAAPALVTSAHAQTCPTNYASITATKIGAYIPLPTGLLIVTATDASHQLINYSVPGLGVELTIPKRVPIVAGALTQTLCLPRSDRTSIPVGYHFVITDTSSAGGNHKVLDAADVAVVTDTWSLDTYDFRSGANPYALTPNVIVAPVTPPAPTAYTVTYGGSVTAAFNATAGSSVTVWPETPAFTSGSLARVRLSVSTAGTFKLKVLRENGDGTITTLQSQTVTAAGTGIQVFDAGKDFAAMPVPYGAVVGITDGTGGWTYVNTDATHTYGAVLSDLAAGSSAAIYQTVAGLVGFTYDLNCTGASAGLEHLTAIPAGSPATFPGGGWISSGWTFSGGTATSTSTGLGTNVLASNAWNGVDRRTITWQFQLTAANTILGFLTYPAEQGLNWGSLVRVNGTANALEIMGGYSGSFANYTGSSPSTVLSASTIPFTLALSHTYTLTWTKNDSRTFTVTITDPANGASGTVTRAANVMGYSSYPTFASDQGAMQGQPGVSVIAGSATLLNFDHRINASPTPILYIVGDSISESLGLASDSQKYGAILRPTRGPDQVVVSAISGGITSGGLARMNAELAIMRPRNVLIYFGYNPDSGWATNLNAMISLARSYGANVLVGTLPVTNAGDQVAKTAAVNALPGITVVHFDLALTATGAGSALNTAMYASSDLAGHAYNDSTHPGPLGHAAMAARVLLDAPFLAY